MQLVGSLSAALLTAASPAAAAPGVEAAVTGSFPPSSFPYRALSVHNQARSSVGAPPLSWDPVLAVGAASYAADMTRSGRWEHSVKTTRPGQGENLWMGRRGIYSIEQMLSYWVAERGIFVPGIFPNVSRDGNWHDVAHYTQMISRRSTRVGCGIASTAGIDYLVCRYARSGNADGLRFP